MNHSNTHRHRTTFVPDLLSFDSWDYDATYVSSTTNSFADSIPSTYSADADVSIQVSGASFTLNQTVFRQLDKLPWSVDECTGVYSLGTSPDLFEIILNYVLFQSLPNFNLLSTSDVEELEPMVLITGLTALHAHLEKNDLKKTLLRNRSFRRNAQQGSGGSGGSGGRGGSGCGGGGGGGGGSDKDVSSLRRQVSEPVLGSSSNNRHDAFKISNSSSKGLAGRLAQAVAARRPSQQPRKMSHADWCASDLVD
jgi:hypothetical protein